jgi:hypothetical protein
MLFMFQVQGFHASRNALKLYICNVKIATSGLPGLNKCETTDSEVDC